MPAYDYRCSKCKHQFTVDKSMSDDSVPKCDSCGHERTDRVWNLFIMASGGGKSDTPPATASTSRKSGCGSCSSHSCGTC